MEQVRQANAHNEIQKTQQLKIDTPTTDQPVVEKAMAPPPFAVESSQPVQQQEKTAQKQNNVQQNKESGGGDEGGDTGEGGESNAGGAGGRVGIQRKPNANFSVQNSAFQAKMNQGGNPVQQKRAPFNPSAGVSQTKSQEPVPQLKTASPFLIGQNSTQLKESPTQLKEAQPFLIQQKESDAAEGASLQMKEALPFLLDSPVAQHKLPQGGGNGASPFLLGQQSAQMKLGLGDPGLVGKSEPQAPKQDAPTQLKEEEEESLQMKEGIAQAKLGFGDPGLVGSEPNMQMKSLEDEESMQMKEEEEESLQMKGEEEEESLQMKGEEEEESLQMKGEEEEESLQMKGEEEEESLQMKGEEEEESLQMKGEEEEESLQMKGEEEEESLQMKGEEEEESMQLKEGIAQMKLGFGDPGLVGKSEPSMQMKAAPLQMAAGESTGGGPSNSTGMPDGVKSKMEGAFGSDFSDVNIHQNSQSATSMGALAYAQGNDVHFAPGQYNPSSQSGQELLGHELTHVVQQREGRVRPTTQRKGANINDDKTLENEADSMGAKAARGIYTGMGSAPQIQKKDAIQNKLEGDAPVQQKEGETTEAATPGMQLPISPNMSFAPPSFQLKSEPAQMKEEEEESMQMKSLEDDESMQMKEEEEESMQMKSLEDDESMQMKEEEEESMQMKSLEDDESMQMKEEEEESMQMKSLEDDESMQMKEEEEESMQLKPVQLAGNETPAPVAEGTGAEAGEQEGGNSQMPNVVSNLTNGFNPPEAVAAYLAEDIGNFREIKASMGALAAGIIKVKQTDKVAEGGTASYELEKKQSLGLLSGFDFFNPLRAVDLEPVIAIKSFGPEGVSGALTVKPTGGEPDSDTKALANAINNNLALLGMMGFNPLEMTGGMTNAVAGGQLNLSFPEFKTTIGEYVEATGSFGLEEGSLIFTIGANVNIGGVGEGNVSITRDKDGAFSGSGDLEVQIANITGTVNAAFQNGAWTIQGKAAIESEKFSGEINLLATDKESAKSTMMGELGVETLGQEAPAPEGGGKKNPGNMVLVGWGGVTARVTEWLEASAKVGVDHEGHVTVVGELTFPDEIELMEQKDKQMDLFEVEVRAGYGIPLVGQVFLFASVGMFAKAGFGPLVLKDVGMTGTYSTDPSVLQNFQITGSLGISAYAILGLEAKGGVGVTLAGHDVKAGLNITGEAGVRAYAEATPTFEYMEKQGEAGGKVGEAWLRGHFEAAAQAFLGLSGNFFVELDSPWWSPAPDDTWEWPLFGVEYPIGNSLGIGADVDYLVGSPNAPEVQFSPVEFDSDKFISDMTKEPAKGGGKGGTKEKPGKWDDKPKGNLSDDPQTTKGSGPGVPTKHTGQGEAPVKEDPKKKKDQKDPKAPEAEAPKKETQPNETPDTGKGQTKDQQAYENAVKDLKELSEGTNHKPVPDAVIRARIKKVKAKYKIQSITFSNRTQGAAYVAIKHKDMKTELTVHLINADERDRQFDMAVLHLNKMLDSLGAPETGAVTQSQTKSAAETVDKTHEVIVGTEVKGQAKDWVVMGDIEDRDRKMTSRPQAEKLGGEGDNEEKKDSQDQEGEQKEGKENDISFLKGVKKGFTEEDGDNHTLFFKVSGNTAKLWVASDEKTIEKYLTELDNTLAPDAPNRKQLREALQIVNGTHKTMKGIKSLKLISSGDVSASERGEVTDALSLLSRLLVHLDMGGLDEDLNKKIKQAMDALPTSSPYEYKLGHARSISHLTNSNRSKGTEPSAKPAWYDTLVGGNMTKSAKGKDKWVRMHLIPDQIGGSGSNALNLVPARNSTNRGPEATSYEDTLKNLIVGKEGKNRADNIGKKKDLKFNEALANVVWGEIKVDFHPAQPATDNSPEMGANEFPSSIDWEAGLYLFANGAWHKDLTQRVFDKKISIDKPLVPAADKINLSKNPSKSGLNSLIPELSATDAREIQLESANGGNPFDDDLADFKQRMIDRFTSNKVDRYGDQHNWDNDKRKEKSREYSRSFASEEVNLRNEDGSKSKDKVVKWDHITAKLATLVANGTILANSN